MLGASAGFLKIEVGMRAGVAGIKDFDISFFFLGVSSPSKGASGAVRWC